MTESSSSIPPGGSAPATGARRPVLLTGATGFVGSHLYPALAAAGVAVRSATRDPEAAAAREPGRDWVALDVEEPHTLAPALEGCRAAFYLIHSMGGRHGDYARREAESAEDFRAAAERAGLERIVYLGGVAPAGEPSRHLASRLRVGEILRAGLVPTWELRAAMIIGSGGSSWKMVRDLARRLPAMVLPRWLRNRSSPVFVEDVAMALVGALEIEGSGWLDVPGPEILSHRKLLDRVALAFGSEPAMLDVPVLTPKLSSYWITLVTGADLALAQELVEGLTSDLLPTGESVWDRLPERRPTPLDEAIREALDDDPWRGHPAPGRIAAIEERVGAGPDRPAGAPTAGAGRSPA